MVSWESCILSIDDPILGLLVISGDRRHLHISQRWSPSATWKLSSSSHVVDDVRKLRKAERKPWRNIRDARGSTRPKSVVVGIYQFLQSPDGIVEFVCSPMAKLTSAWNGYSRPQKDKNVFYHSRILLFYLFGGYMRLLSRLLTHSDPSSHPSAKWRYLSNTWDALRSGWKMLKSHLESPESGLPNVI